MRLGSFFIIGLVGIMVLSACHTRKIATQNQTQKQNNITAITQGGATVVPNLSNSQYLAYVNQYIDNYSDLAMKEMKQYGIPASIILAQGIHESRAGRSNLSLVANNHFGIKCTIDWTGPGYAVDDDKPNECFRKYANAEESFQDHINFLHRKRYLNLYSLSSMDYKAWAYGLKNNGYATNPNYAPILIGIIEKYNLQRFDKINDSGIDTRKAINFNASTLSQTKSPVSTGSLSQNTYQNNSNRVIITDTIHRKFIKVDTIYRYEYSNNAPPNNSQPNYSSPSQSSTPPITKFKAKSQSSLSNTLPDTNQNGNQGSQESESSPVQPNNQNTLVYKVLQGDTLYSISRKFKVAVKDLQNLNSLNDTGIKIDQVLLIPTQ